MAFFRCISRAISPPLPSTKANFHTLTVSHGLCIKQCYAAPKTFDHFATWPPIDRSSCMLMNVFTTSWFYLFIRNHFFYSKLRNRFFVPKELNATVVEISRLFKQYFEWQLRKVTSFKCSSSRSTRSFSPSGVSRSVISFLFSADTTDGCNATILSLGFPPNISLPPPLFMYVPGGQPIPALYALGCFIFHVARTFSMNSHEVF